MEEKLRRYALAGLGVLFLFISIMLAMTIITGNAIIQDSIGATQFASILIFLVGVLCSFLYLRQRRQH